MLLLLGEIDSNTFECQVGDTRGKVQKSRMKIITPLDSASPKSSQQATFLFSYSIWSWDPPSAQWELSQWPLVVFLQGAGSGMKAQAIYDFIPGGSPGFLSIKTRCERKNESNCTLSHFQKKIIIISYISVSWPGISLKVSGPNHNYQKVFSFASVTVCRRFFFLWVA